MRKRPSQDQRIEHVVAQAATGLRAFERTPKGRLPEDDVGNDLLAGLRDKERLAREEYDAFRDIDGMLLADEPKSRRRRAAEIAIAIAAYSDILDKGHTDVQACRGALIGYQSLCPDDANASDAVVDAILTAKEKLVKDMQW